MTDAARPHPDDDLLAAELALGLLSDGAAAAARVREVRDPAFAALVGEWNERLMPLFDAVEPVEPPASLWGRISASLAPKGSGNVIALKRRVRFWRGAAAALTAVAASLAIVVGFRAADRVRPTPPQQNVVSDTLVAAITPEDAPTMAVISFDRAAASLIVTPAALTLVPGHSHELWVVPATGDPRSLGLVAPGAARRVVIAGDVAGLFDSEVTLAISAEQEGGSRTGKPGGPIVATGKLRRV